MTLRNMLLTAVVLSVPAVASAQPVTGVYVGGGLGFNYLQDVNVDKLRANGYTAVVPSGNFHSSGGFVGLGSVGYGFGNGLRLEVEGNYRNQHTNIQNGARGTSGGGNIQSFGPMVNALYDFNGVSPSVVPYVGFGVGYQFGQIQNGNIYNNNARLNFTGGTPGGVAIQQILGAAFPIASVPGLALTAEARAMQVLSQEKFDTTLYSGGKAYKGSASLENQYNWSALVGVRYNFGVAPPPAPVPVAAPAPAPARSYLVFFDWDRYDLSARARQIIAEAAAASTKVQTTRIEVNGYADTSGTPKYNMGLSIRRAQAVTAELVRLGVPKQEITYKGFGDTVLLVPTGPGVREPQNRRVEIILH